MKIAFFHNWSSLGTRLALDLLATGEDELWILGGRPPRDDRDMRLIDSAHRQGALSVASPDVRSSTFASELRAFAPHLTVVATFPAKLPEDILAIAEFAAINVHTSLLPRYRGASPEFWVIRNGERETGVTIHRMTARFDAGPILAQTAFPLTGDDTLGSVLLRSGNAASPLLTAVLQRYRRGERPHGIPQDESAASLAPLVRDADLQIQWTDSTASIDRLVRAASPAFEARSRFRGKSIVVGSVKRASLAGLRPREIRIESGARQLLVGTGDGALIVEVLKFADGPPLTGARFAERYRVENGEALD